MFTTTLKQTNVHNDTGTDQFFTTLVQTNGHKMAALVVVFLRLSNGIRNRAKTCQAYVHYLSSGLILVSSPSPKRDCLRSCPVATFGHCSQGLKRIALSSPKQSKQQKIARNNSVSVCLCLSVCLSLSLKLSGCGCAHVLLTSFVCACACVRVYACMHAREHVCVRAFVCVCTRVCVCVLTFRALCTPV